MTVYLQWDIDKNCNKKTFKLYLKILSPRYDFENVMYMVG